jgi:hypothetical protein
MEAVLARLVRYLLRYLPDRQPAPEDPASRAAIRKRLLLVRLTAMLQNSQQNSLLAISLPLYMGGLARMSGAEIASLLDQALRLLNSLEADVDAECSTLVVETDHPAPVLAFPDRGQRGIGEIDAGRDALGVVSQ